MTIAYHQKPGIPGQYFDCPYGLGTFSTSYCADLHRKANTKSFIQEHRRTTCRFCPVGALHAGDRDTLTASRLFGALLCSRCERVASRMVSGRICVSCYNRERENMQGRNAKGNPLRLVRHYYPVTLLLAKHNVVQLRIMDRVLSMSEAVLSILLSESDNVMFGEVENGLFIHYAN